MAVHPTPYSITASMDTGPLSDVEAFASYMSNLYFCSLNEDSLSLGMPNPPLPSIDWNVRLVRDAHYAVRRLVQARNNRGGQPC